MRDRFVATKMVNKCHNSNKNSKAFVVIFFVTHPFMVNRYSFTMNFANNYGKRFWVYRECFEPCFSGNSILGNYECIQLVLYYYILYYSVLYQYSTKVRTGSFSIIESDIVLCCGPSCTMPASSLIQCVIKASATHCIVTAVLAMIDMSTFPWFVFIGPAGDLLTILMLHL